MITLTGILRQAGEVKLKDKPLLKLVVEHETARGDGNQPDLHLETLFLDRQEAARLPRAGEEVHVEVRAYPSANGRAVQYAGVRLLAAEAPADTIVEP